MRCLRLTDLSRRADLAMWRLTAIVLPVGSGLGLFDFVHAPTGCGLDYRLLVVWPAAARLFPFE